MAKHNDIGRKGEAIAKDYLIREGYDIQATNWTYNRAELDIIAKQGDTLVFVEVKTTASTLSEPALALHLRKQNLLVKAAIAYTHKVNHDWAVRFDLIVIRLGGDWMDKIEHFEDAFFPGF